MEQTAGILFLVIILATAVWIWHLTRQFDKHCNSAMSRCREIQELQALQKRMK